MFPSPISGAFPGGAEPLSLDAVSCVETTPPRESQDTTRQTLDAFHRDLALSLSPQVTALLARNKELLGRIDEAGRTPHRNRPLSSAGELDPEVLADIMTLLRAVPAALLPVNVAREHSTWLRLLRDPVAREMALPPDLIPERDFLGALNDLRLALHHQVKALKRLAQGGRKHDPILVRRLSHLVQWEERRGLAPGTHPQIISDALKSQFWREEPGSYSSCKDVPLDNPTHAPAWPPLELLKLIGPPKHGLHLIMGDQRPADARAFAEQAAAAGTRAISVELRPGEAWPEAFCIDGVFSVRIGADDRSTLNAAFAEIAPQLRPGGSIRWTLHQAPIVAPDGWRLEGDTLVRREQDHETLPRRQAQRPGLGGGLALL